MQIVEKCIYTIPICAILNSLKQITTRGKEMYSTQQKADKARSLWIESINCAESEVACVALEAGDNAAATIQDSGADYRDADGKQTDMFIFWWEASVIDALSSQSNQKVAQWYADRGLEV